MKKSLPAATDQARFGTVTVFQFLFGMAVCMGWSSWWLWEIKQRNVHCIVDHVLRAPWSSRLLFVRAWVTFRALGKVSDRFPRGTFWSIPSTFWWKIQYFLMTSLWKWEKTSLTFYSEAETERYRTIFGKFWLEWLCLRTKQFNWAAGVAMRRRFLKVTESLPVITYIAGYQARKQGGCIPPPDLQRCWYGA